MAAVMAAPFQLRIVLLDESRVVQVLEADGESLEFRSTLLPSRKVVRKFRSVWAEVQ